MERVQSGDELINASVEGRTLRYLYFKVIQPSLAEFFGVLFLTFGLCMFRHDFGCLSEPLGIVSLYISIYSTTRSISGGQLNPIITLIEMVMRETRPLVGICYLGAHLLGAVVGAFALKGVTKTKPEPTMPSVKVGNAIFAEMMGTTIAILAYLTLARRGKATTAILAIGFAYNSAIAFAYRASSGYINPALNFGIAAASGVWTKHYVYWVGTALGGITATLLYGLIFGHDVWIKPRNYTPERIALN